MPSTRFRTVPVAVACLPLRVGCKKSPPANVAATFNNRPITYADLDREHSAQFSGPDVETKLNQVKAPYTLQELRKQLDARIRQGEDFAMLAQNYSEDPNTTSNGRDYGFVPESALEKANVALRKLVMEMHHGETSRIIRTEEGYQILKVISKQAAGQRELNDPRVQQTIRETLLNRTDQLLKAAYFEVARNEAKPMNYFAMGIASNPAGKLAVGQGRSRC